MIETQVGRLHLHHCRATFITDVKTQLPCCIGDSELAGGRLNATFDCNQRLLEGLVGR